MIFIQYTFGCKHYDEPINMRPAKGSAFIEYKQFICTECGQLAQPEVIIEQE